VNLKDLLLLENHSQSKEKTKQVSTEKNEKNEKISCNYNYVAFGYPFWCWNYGKNKLGKSIVKELDFGC
jgi:hypothetical protein